MYRRKRIFSSVAAAIAISIIVSGAIFYYPAAQVPLPINAPRLDGAYIGQFLGTPIVLSNNITGVTTVVLVRQAPTIREPGGIVDNQFTLMNTIIEFKLPPNAQNNQTVYVMGDFSLLESEVNPVIRQMVAFNWTILNLHPHMKEEQPKLQFLHWQARGNITTILSNIKTILGLTTIGITPAITPQTALNVTDIAKRLGGMPVNGPVADVLIARQDGNITAADNPDIVLNGFVLMGSGFEFMAMPTNATTQPSNASRNVFVMGDFALKESEVDAVESVLITSPTIDLIGVTMTSITGQHSHMLRENPKIMFVHFEAMGDLDQLITLLNRALDQTTIKVAQNYTAGLSGQTWVSRINPAVNYTRNTTAVGAATLQINRNNTAIQYSISVANIQNVTMSHIHLDTGVVVGPIVAWLYPRNQTPTLIPGTFSGVLAQGTITSDNLIGPLAGHTIYELANIIAAGKAYIEVHTTQNPQGEIRGWIPSPLIPVPPPTPTPTATPTTSPTTTPTTTPTMTPTTTPNATVSPTITPTPTASPTTTPTTTPTPTSTATPSPTPTTTAPPSPKIIIIKIVITKISVVITLPDSSTPISNLNLKAGDIVNAVMTNMDDRPHCWAITTEPNGNGKVMFDAEIGAGHPLNPGETGSDTFTVTQPGNFYYMTPTYDSLCSELSGRVTVAP